MISESFRAMGTVVDVFAETASGIAETVGLFAEIESVCSRFLPDSELSAINRRTGDTVTVSPLMRRVLGAAATMRDLTDGVVDPAVGARVVDWGYDRSFELVGGLDRPPPQDDIGAWELAGDRLRLDPGVQLDLGGIAKGWACDEAVERGQAVVVSAGGDVRSAHDETRVEILGADDEVAAVTPIGVGALATSSVRRRRWTAGGEPAHHLIDPRTGDPAVSPVLSASAVAATAVAAEAGAKAALIHGAAGLAWLDGCTWLHSGLVVWHDGTVYTTGRWRVAA